jgi:aspartate racemase
MTDAGKLAAAGVEFFILPDNTAHIALEAPGDPFPTPGLHIAEALAEQAVQEDYQKITILGTNWTMKGLVYPRALGRRGVGWEVPEEGGRSKVHSRDHLPRALPW